ncbi:PRSS1_2_3 [Lepeophtheirus salmonis]|uniref:PRSS1_2_3 n=1 Tax=Lepeophtheirus salmonis TaxID=72036 RepID=A0A7R8HB76_LEPSM|nr:PRSS1_2_3 [Lepeophtheirus salmonis]CAF2980888.1 PRSS1_2_3 [Lepeophtheirus salmonis]
MIIDFIVNNECQTEEKSSLALNEKVKPVALPEKDQEFTGDVVVSGWGTVEFGGSSSDVLRSVTLQLVSDEYCSDAYDGHTDESMICAGSPGKDSCQGLGETTGFKIIMRYKIFELVVSKEQAH